MITIEQCRAARGLLGWTQQDLAEACGLSKTAINNFEKGHSDIKADSLKAIHMAFESVDIEFLPNQGLRKKTDSVKILKGPNAMAQLLDDIYYTLKNNGGQVSVIDFNKMRENSDVLQEISTQQQRLKAAGITEKIICSQKTAKAWENALPDDTRIIPDNELDAGMASFIYDHKVALELWSESMIIIIESTDACQAEQRRFDYLWGQSANPANHDAASTAKA